MTAEYEGAPVHVHVASAAPGALAGKTPGACSYRAVYRTIYLTSEDNGHELWSNGGENVDFAIAQALDDDVTISKARADAEKGVGYTIPKANTAPTPLRDSGLAWVANGTGTFSGGSGSYSRVSVAVFYKVES